MNNQANDLLLKSNSSAEPTLNKSSPLLQCINVCKSYVQGTNDTLTILDGVHLIVNAGETVSIMGSSGTGKSTLLHILAGLDKVTSGDVILDGESLVALNDTQICKIRNTKLGFIYQFHHLLPEFTALENVLIPFLIQNNNCQQEYALHLLSRLGLENRRNHFPAQLSGGERQRVAIARAIVNNPKLVFADEPTGNLDNQTGNSVLDIFFELQAEMKTSLIIVTHDIEVAAKTQSQYRLSNGTLTAVTKFNYNRPLS